MVYLVTRGEDLLGGERDVVAAINKRDVAAAAAASVDVGIWLSRKVGERGNVRYMGVSFYIVSVGFY